MGAGGGEVWGWGRRGGRVQGDGITSQSRLTKMRLVSVQPPTTAPARRSGAPAPPPPGEERERGRGLWSWG